MNDLMTKSFLSYVELKKQAMKDAEAEADLEMGQFDPRDEQNLSKFFEDVTLIKNDMEEITNLLLDLQDLKQEAKTTHSAKVLRGIRDRINSDMVTILRKARTIKSRLELLDQTNIENRDVDSMAFKEGSHVDRTRTSVTNGLRVKLREMMIDFQSLREQIVEDHKQGLKRRYYNVTGEEPSEEMVAKMILGSGGAGGDAGGQLEKVFEGKEELVLENSERQEALKEIQRSLTELHYLFLDMAVLVETQGENINDIENNVAQGGIHINGGTNGLFYAKQMNKKRNWARWIAAFVLLLVLVWIIISFAF